jgi:hypothetical protein
MKNSQDYFEIERKIVGISNTSNCENPPQKDFSIHKQTGIRKGG